MKYGMTTEQFSLLDSLVVAPLKHHGAQVFLFGSRATGRYHPHSDVDLMYRGEIPTIVLSKIRENIEDSPFPFIVEIVNEKDLAESYRTSVYHKMQEL